MRTRLLNSIGERHHGRLRRRRRRGPGLAVEPEQIPRPCDPDLQRVREAGGPVDQASYTCGCGYFFRAAVSTSVICPHCGVDQGW
jgi:hypothetical protein